MHFVRWGLLTAVMAALAACALGDDGEVDVTPDKPRTASDNDAGPRAIYVARAGRDDASGATPTEPLKSIAAAIGRARQCPGTPCVVLLAAGRYEEAIELGNGVSLLGGYGPDFAVRDPARFAVTITSANDRTVVASNLTKPTTLDYVSIEGADLSAQPGQSSYALWVKDCGSSLFVSHATIQGGRGGHGAPGATLPDPTCTGAGGAGGGASDCDSARGANGGASGDPVAGGEGGGGGSNNCPSACPLVGSDGIGGGARGADGNPGADGAGGTTAASAAGAFADGLWIPSSGLGGARGFHGTGGGGGGAGGSKRFRACFGCDTLVGGRGADGAPGGCGGAAGTAGGAGGGGFAVVADNSQITLQDVTLRGGVGGDGGPGGPGLPGKPGGTQTETGREGGRGQRCGLINYSSGAGGAGGVGGHGGAGGGGAGGVGGPSVALTLVGGGAVVRYGAVEAIAGTGGAAGPPGNSPGHAGEAGPPGIAEGERQF